MYAGAMSQGTIVCGKFVSSSLALGILILGKVFLVIGISLFITLGFTMCSYYDSYEYYECEQFFTNLTISGSVFTTVGGILVIAGAILYYRIRKHPVRNPAARVYNQPPPLATYPAPPYPGAAYQYPAPGTYPGQTVTVYPGQPGQPGQNYPGQPGQNYPGQPGQNYPGQPGQNYPGQPGQGYIGQPGQNYPAQPTLAQMHPSPSQEPLE